MNQGYTFSQELLRMMLSEERQKFVAALGRGSSWRELNRIRKTINQLNILLDSANIVHTKDYSQGRYNDQGLR